MTIRTRMCISIDGFVATSDGLPVQLADPSFVPGESHAFPEFQRSLEAVLKEFGFDQVTVWTVGGPPLMRSGLRARAVR